MKGLHFECGHSPLKPALQHELFFRAERDAGLLIDQATEPVEVPAGKTIGVHGQGISGESPYPLRLTCSGTGLDKGSDPLRALHGGQFIGREDAVDFEDHDEL